MKNIFAAIIIMLLATAYASAHTTVIFPHTTENGARNLMVAHFLPWYGDNIKGIRFNKKDTVDVKGIESISLIHNGEERDISGLAVPGFLEVRHGRGECYAVPLKRKIIPRAGDYIFVVKHAPHWKGHKDIYVGKISKFFINNAGLITDWPHRVLKEAPEIIPLSAPDSVYAGTLFRAEAVDDKGEHIPHGKIHVEFLNYKINDRGIADSGPLLENKKAGDTFLFTDGSGAFSFVPPREGVWTFTLVDGGRDIKINGKKLQYDSSISLQVKSLQ